MKPHPPIYKIRSDYKAANTAQERLIKAITNPSELINFTLFKHKKFVRQLKRQYLLAKSNDGYITRNIQGSLMKLDLNDPGISTDLALDGIREPLITQKYQEELRRISSEIDSPLVAELGANIGYYAFMPLTINNSFDILAVEVEEDNYKKLIENAKLNNYESNMTFVNIAVGSKEREVELTLSRESNTHSINEENNDQSDTLAVKEKPLPQICDENGYSIEDVNVLRLDTEGYEYEIISGIPQLQSDSELLIHIEFHVEKIGDKAEKLVERLSKENAEVVIATIWGEELKVDDLEDLLDYKLVTAILRIPPI